MEGEEKKLFTDPVTGEQVSKKELKKRNYKLILSQENKYLKKNSKKEKK